VSGESIAMAIFGMITGGALSAIAFSFGMVGRLSTIEEKINGLERRMDNMGIRLDNIKIDSPPCEFHVKLDKETALIEGRVKNLEIIEGLKKA